MESHQNKTPNTEAEIKHSEAELYLFFLHFVQNLTLSDIGKVNKYPAFT